MPSSPEPAQIVHLAQRLLGNPVRSAAPVKGGRNSTTYRIDADTGRFAVKLYPPVAADGRDRRGKEAAALTFMAALGIVNIPQLVASDAQANATLMTWIDGQVVSDPGLSDIDSVLAFVSTLHGGRESVEAAPIGDATEACLTAADLRDQVSNRFGRLATIIPDHPVLQDIVATGRGLCDAAVTALEGCYRAIGISPDQPTPRECQTLSASDFGFHNAVRRDDGSLCFLDFEYFGWDDPVKVVADFLLHPGMSLTAEQQREFARRAGALYGGNDPHFRMRLAACYPIYALRWAGIVLNPFFATQSDPVHAALLQERVLKSKKFLEIAALSMEGFPHASE